MCHGLSKLCVEKTIEMTDTDIVRTPFFEHHIDEIIGDGVGMVVALVQLNFFLRTLAVDAGGKSQLQSAEQEQRECRKRRGKEVFHAAARQKEQAEQEEQRIEKGEQGSHHRMDHDQLVTHIS